MDPTTLIVSLVIALAAIFILANSIKIIRQQRVGVASGDLDMVAQHIVVADL